MRSLSLELSDIIREQEGSDSVKQFLSNEKRRISNGLALVQNLHSCEALLEADPYMVSGKYVLADDDNQMQLWSCQVSEGELTLSVYIGAIDQPGSCADTGSCELFRVQSEVIICKSTPDQPNQCEPRGLIVPPVLKADLGSVACVYGENYGFTTNGVWTTDGCSGRFEVKFFADRGTLDAMANDKFWGEDPARAPFCRPNTTGISIASLTDISSLRSRHNWVTPERAQCSPDSERAKRSRHTLESLVGLFENYKTIHDRKSGANSIRKAEIRVERKANDLTQRLIHNERLRTCSELSELLPDAISGEYFFYSSQPHPEHRRVRPKSVSCDFRKIVWTEKPEVRATYQATATTNPRNDVAMKSEFLSIPWHSMPFMSPSRYLGDDVTTVIAANPYTSPILAGFRVSKCYPRKAIEIPEHGPYSYLKKGVFGDIIVIKKGLRYCFRIDEEQRFDTDHIAHSYLMSSGAVDSIFERDIKLIEDQESSQKVTLAWKSEYATADLQIEVRGEEGQFSKCKSMNNDGMWLMQNMLSGGLMSDGWIYSDEWDGSCSNSSRHALAASTQVRICGRVPSVYTSVSGIAPGEWVCTNPANIDSSFVRLAQAPNKKQVKLSLELNADRYNKLDSYIRPAGSSSAQLCDADLYRIGPQLSVAIFSGVYTGSPHFDAKILLGGSCSASGVLASYPFDSTYEIQVCYQGAFDASTPSGCTEFYPIQSSDFSVPSFAKEQGVFLQWSAQAEAKSYRVDYETSNGKFTPCFSTETVGVMFEGSCELATTRESVPWLSTQRLRVCSITKLRGEDLELCSEPLAMNSSALNFTLPTLPPNLFEVEPGTEAPFVNPWESKLVGCLTKSDMNKSQMTSHQSLLSNSKRVVVEMDGVHFCAYGEQKKNFKA